MSYQLYVTGGYGFTESILPSLLHPSNAVDIAQDYFARGYQGQHIDLPPDADFPQTGTLTDSQKQTLLDDLQEGRLVLASRYEPGFALFTEPKASRDLLRNDLPAALRQRLDHQWPGAGRSGGRGGRSRSDSLAPANEPVHYSPEPPVPELPRPGAGAYQLTLAYRWPDGTPLARLPFEAGTDQDSVKGTLDHKGEARLEGLNGRFATARLNTEASDDEVRHQRRRIQYTLNEILRQERKEADELAQEYQHLPWYQRGLIITGAAFQGVTDAGIGLLQFAGSVAELASPSQLMMDGLNAAWSASEDRSDTNWYDTFHSTYDDTRHQRWVKALGFSPSDITREDIAEAYELANLVMDDPTLKQSLNDFAKEYASIQHRTEVSYLAGSVAFDLILAALLAIATGGAGAAASNIRHARILTHLGETVQAYGKAVRAQRLRHLWRNIDLSKQNRLEAIAPKRVKGQKLKPARPAAAIAAKRLIVNSFEEVKAALQASQKSIIANGKAPAPKYSQAELAQIAQAGVGNEKYIVRLVEEPHLNKGGTLNGTLGASGPAGVRVWSTTLDQMAHQDTDPRLIAQQLGVDYDPTKTYKLAIIDQAEAVKQADAITMVPTYKNLTGFVQEKLPGKVQNPELAREVMTPEYSKQYETLVRDMPDSAWEIPKEQKSYLMNKGLNARGRQLFKTRLDIQDTTGANPHFTGNGLTKATSSFVDNPIYGAVETFSLHKNPKTFRQMTGMEGGNKWVELVDLNRIELGD